MMYVATIVLQLTFSDEAAFLLEPLALLHTDINTNSVVLKNIIAIANLKSVKLYC